MSSLIILNLKELLRGSNLEGLARIANIGKKICLPTNSKLCYSLFWVFRDVTLKRPQQTDDEFLKEQLQTVSSNNRFNVKIINRLFTEQKSFCLPIPADGDPNNPNETAENRIANLQTLPFEKLKRDFDYKINLIVRTAREKVRLHPIRDGRMFIQFIEQIIEQLNQGSIVNIDNARTSALNNCTNELVKYIKNEFQTKITKHDPLEADVFNDCVNKILVTSKSKLENEILNNMDASQKNQTTENFEKDFNLIKSEFEKKNLENIAEFNNGILDNFWDQIIKTKLSAGQFKDVEDFKNKINILKDKYKNESKGEIKMKTDIYSAFVGKNGKDVDFIIKYFADWQELQKKYDLMEKYNRLEKIHIELKLENMGQVLFSNNFNCPIF
jgi:hypothetical protein